MEKLVYQYVISKSAIWRIILCILAGMSLPARGQGIKTVPFQVGYQPSDQLMDEIYTKVEQSIKGQFLIDNIVDSAQNFLNHWFGTSLFDKLVYAAGVEFQAADGPVDGPIWIWELYFRKERDAIKALNWMDTWGLRRARFFPPANWFWIYFRGRILFMGCIRMTPFEGVYKELLMILLEEVHRQRVRGN